MAVAAFYDGNWLLHRAESIAGKFSSAPEKRIPLLVLTWFCTYAIRLKATHGALCFDGGQNFRHELYSGYKSSRHEASANERREHGTSKSDNTYALLQPTLSLFNLTGLPYFQHSKLEADDLVAAGAFAFTRDGERSYRPGNRAYIVSPDKDLVQRVDRKVSIFIPGTSGKPDRHIGVPEVVQLRGMKPRQFCDYQTLIGDSTDDIPPIMAPAKAKALLREHGSLKAYFGTKAGSEFFREHGNELIRNRRLVSMAYLAWKPTDAELQLRPLSENDHIIIEQYGSLPASLTALRAILSPSKKGLF